MPGQHSLGADGEWELDETLVDERYVAVHIANKGLFVFTACSHAGLINVLTHAAIDSLTFRSTGYQADSMCPFNLALIAAAHCTGWRAIGALATRFKYRVVSPAAGKRFAP